ncbi:MAG: hypothetical protein ACWA5X_09090 [bacterium]
MRRDEKRIVLLRGAIKLLVLLGVLLIATALYLGGQKDSSSGSGGAGVGDDVLKVDINRLPKGELAKFSWGGRNVLVLRRSQNQLEGMSLQSLPLQDPDSRWSRQPGRAQTPWRSLDQRYFVAIDLTPDTGCALKLEQGLLVGVCDGAKYDLAGRVLKDQSAKRNLEVPPHHIEGKELVIGE